MHRRPKRKERQSKISDSFPYVLLQHIIKRNKANRNLYKIIVKLVIYRRKVMALTHSIRHFCPETLSVILCPEISSKRTTPNEYTSALVENFPLSKSSGASYPIFSTFLFLRQFFNSFF